MFFASVKITRKRVAVFLSTVVVFGVLSVLFLSAMKSNEENGDTRALRAAFFESCGIDISSAEEQEHSITLPENDTEAVRVFTSVQKQNGFDALPLLGKTVTKYSYLLEAEDVVASLYVLKGNVVGAELFCLDTFSYIPVSEFGDL